MGSFLVVGGGVAGCAVADTLAGSGAHDITIVDAGPVAGAITELVPVLDGGGDYPRAFGIGGGALINGGVVTPDDGDAARLIGAVEPAALGAIGARLLAGPLGRTRGAGTVSIVTDRGRYGSEALRSPSVVVHSRCRVERLLVDDGRVVGVTAIETAPDVLTDAMNASTGASTGPSPPMRAVEFFADHIVLCAGAIGTPALLWASGWRHDAVGDRLSDHPAVMLAVEHDDAPGDQVSQFTGWVPRRDESGLVNGEILAVEYLDSVTDGLAGVLVTLTDTRSRGRVRFDPNPVIERGMFSDARDRTSLATHARAAIGWLTTQSDWRVYIDGDGTPLDAVASEPAFYEWIDGHNGHVFHAASTCSGLITTSRRRPDNRTVGNVRDPSGAPVAGLTIADASALPVAPRQNMMLAVSSQAAAIAAELGARC